MSYNYVLELGIDVSDRRWNEFKQNAANWLIDTIGPDGFDWVNMDVPINKPVTLGFKHVKHMRMFNLWSEMQGVSNTFPSEIEINGGDRFVKIQVNI